MPASTWREVRIAGSLMFRFLPTGTHYGHTGNYVSGACTVARDVIAAIDAAQADGARRLLVVLDDAKGGELDAAYAVADRLRRFSREVAPVIAFVREAWSSAPHVALAGDFLVLAPDGFVAIHGAGAAPGIDVTAIHERSAQWLASRTGMSASELLLAMEEAPAEAKRAFSFEGPFARQQGVADEIGSLERARELAAGAPLPPTQRSRRLARLARRAALVSPPVGAHAVQSSDGGTTQRSPEWALGYRVHELAAARWEQITGLSTGLGAVASNGAGTLVAVGNGVNDVSTDDGKTWTAGSIGAGFWRAVVWAAPMNIASPPLQMGSLS